MYISGYSEECGVLYQCSHGTIPKGTLTLYTIKLKLKTLWGHNERWFLRGDLYGWFSKVLFPAGILRYSICHMKNRTGLCPYLGTVDGKKRV